ncbi:MAG: GNAT family N-acetyltransferase [Deltaproteobacteria bacterium]|nr:GNAT family N-acetyltransferase [Deltaproteobacteria bacterium]
MKKRNQSSSEINLRPAGVEDVKFLKEVFAGTRPDVMENPLFKDKEKKDFINSQFNLQDVHYRKNYPGARFMIISEGGLDTGRLYLHEGKEDIRIMDIAILPPFRGRGMGSLLIRELQTQAADSEKSLSIHVEENNPAKNLYHRLGFEAQGEKVNGVYQLMVWKP